MGQRSQMIVGFTNAEPKGRGVDPACERSAMHFQWRWGPELIVCAAQSVRLARKQMKNPFLSPGAKRALAAQCATYSVNQLSGEIQGWESVEEETKWLNESGSNAFDNNNGMFLIQLHASHRKKEGTEGHSFTFGFTIGEENGGDNATVVNADEYLKWFGATVKEWRDNDETREALDAALETLHEAEADGFLMSQAEANKLCGTRAEYEEAFTRPAT